MSRSGAAALLRQADREPEEYWTGDEYHPTDLDVCGPLSAKDTGVLRELGFEWSGMHWVRDRGHAVAVQFPDSRIDGDEGRVVRELFGKAVAAIISLEDLYLDRLRQATAHDNDRSIEFKSALAVVAARYEDIDWGYVRGRLAEIATGEPGLATEMRRIDRRLRQRVRRALSRPPD